MKLSLEMSEKLIKYFTFNGKWKNMIENFWLWILTKTRLFLLSPKFYFKQILD